MNGLDDILKDEENLYKFKDCLEFAQIKAVEDYDKIKSENIFAPDEKVKDINVYYFAKSILKKLGFE